MSPGFGSRGKWNICKAKRFQCGNGNYSRSLCDDHGMDFEPADSGRSYHKSGGKYYHIRSTAEHIFRIPEPTVGLWNDGPVSIAGQIEKIITDGRGTIWQTFLSG